MKFERSETFQEHLRPANIGIKENTDARHLLDGLQPSIWGGDHSAARAIGRVWNGSSQLSFGTAKLEAGEMSALLRHLREKLRALGDDGIALPDTSSVRLVEAHVSQDKLLIVDFVIDEVCIPIGFPDHLFEQRGRDWKERLAVRYLEHVEAARKHRKKLSSRDITMRSSFAALVRNIGCDCRGAWLRMSPVSCLSIIGFDRDPYDYALVILDQKLDEKLEGYRAWNARELRGLASIFRSDQRRLSQRRSKIIEAGASGMVDTVAEALLHTLGKQADEVWKECAERSRRGESEPSVEIGNSDSKYHFHFREGVLSSSLYFQCGTYMPGLLILNINLTEANCVSAKGRLLSDFVDYPPFQLSKVVVNKVDASQGATELRHPIRTKLIFPQCQSVPDSRTFRSKNQRGFTGGNAS